MSREKEEMSNSDLYDLADRSDIIRQLLSYREQLLTMALEDVLSEEHSIEELEALEDQYQFIGLQLRGFRENCESEGTQQELDIADEIMVELRNEIAVHTAMIGELIWAKGNSAEASGGGEPQDDQLTKELKRELAILKLERDKEEDSPPEVEDNVEAITYGAEALNLSSINAREMTESKAEMSESDEVKLVETTLEELRQAREDALDVYRSNPRRGVSDKKESLMEIAR